MVSDNRIGTLSGLVGQAKQGRLASSLIRKPSTLDHLTWCVLFENGGSALHPDAFRVKICVCGCATESLICHCQQTYINPSLAFLRSSDARVVRFEKERGGHWPDSTNCMLAYVHVPSLLRLD